MAAEEPTIPGLDEAFAELLQEGAVPGNGVKNGEHGRTLGPVGAFETTRLSHPIKRILELTHEAFRADLIREELIRNETLLAYVASLGERKFGKRLSQEEAIATCLKWLSRLADEAQNLSREELSPPISDALFEKIRHFGWLVKQAVRHFSQDEDSLYLSRYIGRLQRSLDALKLVLRLDPQTPGRIRTITQNAARKIQPS